MDTAVWIAVIGLAGTVATAIAGAIVAVWTNKSEKKATAETTLEKTLRERLTLRDEQIDDLKSDNQRLLQIVASQELELHTLREKANGS